MALAADVGSGVECGASGEGGGCGDGWQVKVLLEAGAEVFVKDTSGNTPRDYCSDYPVRP
eukprot:1928659-Rhodomonas_salina.2